MTASVETPVHPAAMQDEPNDPQVAPSRELLEQTGKIVSEGRAALEDSDATLDMLMAKPRRKLKFPVTLADEDGTPVVRTIRYRALSPEEWDALVAAHPPTDKHKEAGSTWNNDTFPPALIAAVSLSPKLTVSQAKGLYLNPEWSPGERRELFFQALDCCGAGLNVPFNAGD